MCHFGRKKDKGLKTYFMAVKKLEKRYLFIFKRRSIYSS